MATNKQCCQLSDFFDNLAIFVGHKQSGVRIQNGVIDNRKRGGNSSNDESFENKMLILIYV